jgi:hypothetical protein
MDVNHLGEIVADAPSADVNFLLPSAPACAEAGA